MCRAAVWQSITTCSSCAAWHITLPSTLEGFFGRLKNEFFHHRDWSDVTIPEFCRMLDAYLRYYNEERPKEKLGWLSPMQYRRSLGVACQDVVYT